jgi:hypothetical protein
LNSFFCKSFFVSVKLLLEHRVRQKLEMLHHHFLEHEQMSEFFDFLSVIASLTPDRVSGLVALAAIGLSGFAIYALHSLAKDRGDNKSK